MGRSHYARLRQLAWALVCIGCLQYDASAHGSVTPDKDLCLITIGFYSAHFKIYLPQTRQHRDYCEDLPEPGETLFVMEYEHRSLSQLPIDFRVIRNVTGQGRFTRLQHVQRIGNLDAVTVFHHPPAVQRDVFTVMHRFEATGDFVGIVTVEHPDTGRPYTAVFPFTVGFTGPGIWPYFAAAATGLLLYYLWMIGWFEGRRFGKLPKRQLSSFALVLFLSAFMPAEAADSSAGNIAAVSSENGCFRLSYESTSSPVTINRIHSWILHIEDAEGRALEEARIQVTGGMPAHDHGLPTRPGVTAYLGNGDYLLEGLRFHMPGEWELILDVVAAACRDRVTIRFRL